MPSVLGLLEDRELAARQRVESLLEEMDRLMAVLREAQAGWQRLVITRETVSEVLTVPHEPGAPDAVGAAAGDAGPAVPSPAPEETAAAPRSAVPVWRQGLEVAALSPDYQRIMTVVADRGRSGGGPVNCREIAAALGLELVAAKVEGVRSKAKRLVERGWLAEPVPGRFSLATLRGGGS
ncbi:hypothetical protein [Actinacidiphila soli]|jgi:hypothetical protein|uniref:hypothetical protein n=1 Tax=Actinacidiphila soli TaxID=2487275 RepID=UPI000FCAC5B8|nr:hypothetical protein [Actinacidiphila soli]